MVDTQFLLHFKSVGSLYCVIHIIKSHEVGHLRILIALFSKEKILLQLQKVFITRNQCRDDICLRIEVFYLCVHEEIIILKLMWCNQSLKSCFVKLVDLNTKQSIKNQTLCMMYGTCYNQLNRKLNSCNDYLFIFQKIFCSMDVHILLNVTNFIHIHFYYFCVTSNLRIVKIHPY